MLSPILPILESLPLRIDVANNTATDTVTSKITDIIRTELAKTPKPEYHPCACSHTQRSYLQSRVHSQEAATSAIVPPANYASPRKKRRLADMDSAHTTHDGHPPKQLFSGDDDLLGRTTTVPPLSPPSLIGHQLPAAAARKISVLKQKQQPLPLPQIQESHPSVAPDNNDHNPAPSSQQQTAVIGDVCRTSTVSIAQSSTSVMLNSGFASASASVPTSTSSATVTTTPDRRRTHTQNPGSSTRSNTHTRTPIPSTPRASSSIPLQYNPPKAAPSPSFSLTSGLAPRSAVTTSSSCEPSTSANRATATVRPDAQDTSARTRLNTPVQQRKGSNPLKRSIAGTNDLASPSALFFAV